MPRPPEHALGALDQGWTKGPPARSFASLETPLSPTASASPHRDPQTRAQLWHTRSHPSFTNELLCWVPGTKPGEGDIAATMAAGTLRPGASIQRGDCNHGGKAP